MKKAITLRDLDKVNFSLTLQETVMVKSVNLTYLEMILVDDCVLSLIEIGRAHV